MKYESYNRELVYATAMFMDVFNNIKITRNNGKKIRVKCLNGNRSRIFKSLENPDRTAIQPPVIAIKRTSIERDTSRVSDINRGIALQSSSTIDYNLYAPNPINLTFEVAVLTKYQSDMDQILCNFIPFSNQSFFVETPNPKNPEKTIRHEVVWNGSISEDGVSEIPFDVADIKQATTSFVFKTWIWPGKPYDQGTYTQPNRIEKINVFPNLCSIGVQKLLWEAGVSTFEEFAALSGFNLDNEWYGDIYSVSHWYAVDRSVSFNDYMGYISSGLITPPFYDSLPLSAGVSGYVSDLGYEYDLFERLNLSGKEVYFIDNKGGILIYATSGDVGEVPIYFLSGGEPISDYTSGDSFYTSGIRYDSDINYDSDICFDTSATRSYSFVKKGQEQDNLYSLSAVCNPTVSAIV